VPGRLRIEDLARVTTARRGGTRSQWSAGVTFRAAPGQVITIAAAAGGHIAAVQRFAVTGARAGDG
jgi:hypothetical protein